MAVFTHLETDTGTNVDISSATAVGAYTSTGDKLIMVDVSIDAVAGNGDYVMYVTRQIGGSGSAYRILPQTTMAAASGLTAISGQSGWITVRNGDVLTCYVDGLAGDTSTPDWSTRWFELAGVTAAAVADSVWEEAIADHTTSTTFGGKNQKVVPSETVGDYKADVSGVADAVWDEALAGHAEVGSAGAALAASGSAGDPWSTALPGAYGAGTAGKAIADIVAKTDQLDVSSTSFVTAVSGSTITILRGDTLSASLLNLGSLSSYVSIDFTVKRGTGELDTDAVLRIRKNASNTSEGLVWLNGATHATGTDGSITITDAPTGDVTIMLKAGVTDDLVPGSYVYDIQLIEAAGVTTLTTGGLVVTADVTRLVA